MLGTVIELSTHAQGACKGITYLPLWGSGKTPQAVTSDLGFEGQGGISQGDQGWVGDSVTGETEIRGAARDVCEDATRERR